MLCENANGYRRKFFYRLLRNIFNTLLSLVLWFFELALRAGAIAKAGNNLAASLLSDFVKKLENRFKDFNNNIYV